MSDLFRKTLQLLAREKKWWLIPLIITAVIIGVLLWLLRTPEPISPFMYSR